MESAALTRPDLLHTGGCGGSWHLLPALSLLLKMEQKEVAGGQEVMSSVFKKCMRVWDAGVSEANVHRGCAIRALCSFSALNRWWNFPSRPVLFWSTCNCLTLYTNTHSQPHKNSMDKATWHTVRAGLWMCCVLFFLAVCRYPGLVSCAGTLILIFHHQDFEDCFPH